MTPRELSDAERAAIAAQTSLHRPWRCTRTAAFESGWIAHRDFIEAALAARNEAPMAVREALAELLDWVQQNTTNYSDEDRDLAVRNAIDALAAREAGKLPGDAQRVPGEMAERMAVIEKLAGVLADPSDDRECDCHGEGIDREGAEWTLCECVLRRIGDLPGDARRPTAGLREALTLLNAFHKHLANEGQTEGPYFVSTNALVQEIANRERSSISDVVASLRDTEREHEPAGEKPPETQARHDAREVFSANIHHPDAVAEFGDPQTAHTPEECFDQGWLALEGYIREALGEPADSLEPVDTFVHGYHVLAGEAQRQFEERKTAERHAAVLAKALDEFFRKRPTGDLPGAMGRLLHEVRPTLRALGYPKEEGA